MFQNNFTTEIEELRMEKGISNMDAVILWCENNKIELEQAADWIKKDSFLKANIQFEAEDLRFLKRSGPTLI